MSAKRIISKEILDFYSGTSEEDRLKYGLGPLEFERNKELISRHLKTRGLIIADIGGGPGIYAEWLANQSHDVVLIDPVEKHIQQAKKRAGKLKKPYTAKLGESRNLDIESSEIDVVILHGPLYHLQERKDRIKALKESYRILKPGGVLLAFAINYTASTLVGLTQGVFTQEEIFEMSMQELQTGEHEAPANMPGVLPKAYYHKPEELQEEITEAGFQYKSTFAVEGLAWLDKNYFETRSDETKKAKAMQLLKVTEQDKNLLAVSPHMMGVGWKAVSVREEGE